jgi:ribosomal protein S18 acetylase RimI-like enzyme
MTAPGPNGAAVPTRRSSAVPDLFVHQPPPGDEGQLKVTVTHLELAPVDWTRRGLSPSIAISLSHERAPTAAFYRDVYDRVGRPWLWYERRLLADDVLAKLLHSPEHELHVARHDGLLVGYFELNGEEIVFFGLTLAYLGRRIGPWLLDKAIERGFERGARRLILNTNTLDHPRALDTYRKAGFRVVRSENKQLQDPRVLWPDIYRWPPK